MNLDQIIFLDLQQIHSLFLLLRSNPFFLSVLSSFMGANYISQVDAFGMCFDIFRAL